jgi:hypothetical protein
MGLRGCLGGCKLIKEAGILLKNKTEKIMEVNYSLYG